MDGGINNFGENCLMKLVTLEKLCIDLRWVNIKNC